jgi:hypothetical protein
LRFLVERINDRVRIGARRKKKDLVVSYVFEEGDVEGLVLFISEYRGEGAAQVALSKSDGLESVYDEVLKADRIRRFRIDEIERGVIAAIGKAFGK